MRGGGSKKWRVTLAAALGGGFQEDGSVRPIPGIRVDYYLNHSSFESLLSTEIFAARRFGRGWECRRETGWTSGFRSGGSREVFGELKGLLSGLTSGATQRARGFRLGAAAGSALPPLRSA